MDPSADASGSAPDALPSLPVRLGKAWPLLLVCSLALAPFARTLDFDLVWDDRPLVTAIDAAVAERGPGHLLFRSFSTGAAGPGGGYYRPVTAASLWLDSRLQTVSASSFHLTNLLLHGTCSLLVYILLARLFSHRAGALAGAVLFAVHPVHVESVAFVSGRTDLLAALFVLVSTILWLGWRRNPPPRSTWYLAGGSLAFLAACLSKETAFVLPAVLVVIDLTDPDRHLAADGWLRRNLSWISAWGLALIAAGALRLVSLGLSLGLESPAGGAAGLMPAAVSPLMVAGGTLQYMRMAVWPWPLKTFYAAPDLSITGSVLAGATLFLFLVWAAARRNRPGAWLSGVAWFFLFLVPVSGIFPRGGAVIAERFLYLPSIGVCFLLAAVLKRSRLSRTAALALLTAAVAAAAVMVLAIHLHSEKWRDNVVLYTALSEDAPGHPVGPYNLGTLLADGGAYHLAIPVLEEALRRDDGHLGARFNLANSLAEAGRRTEAEAHYRQIVVLQPNFHPARVNLSLLLIGLGRSEEALGILEGTGSAGTADARFLLALTLANLRMGERKTALEYFRQLEEVDPETARKYGGIVGSGRQHESGP